MRQSKFMSAVISVASFFQHLVWDECFECEGYALSIEAIEQLRKKKYTSSLSMT